MGDGHWGSVPSVYNLASITATGASPSSDLQTWKRCTIQVVNGATNTFTATVEGSPDNVNWYTVAYGTGSSAAYTQAAFNVAGSAKALLFLPPSDGFRYVRLNVSAANANGTAVSVYVEG